jgi:hypothetical protein
MKPSRKYDSFPVTNNEIVCFTFCTLSEKELVVIPTSSFCFFDIVTPIIRIVVMKIAFFTI